MAQAQIIFEVETPYGMYRDALYFPEGQVPPDDELALLKQQRVDNWIAVVTAPPVEVIPDAVEEPPLNG